MGKSKKNRPLAGADLKRAINSYYKELGEDWTSKYRKNKEANIRDLLNFLGRRQFTRENFQKSIREFKDKWSPNTLKQYVKNITPFVRYLFDYKDNKYYDWASKIPIPKVNKVRIPRLGAKLMVDIIVAGTEPGLGDNSLNRERKNETREALFFQLFQGLRVNEVLWIKGEDIHLEAKIPQFFTKRKGGDIVPLALSGLSEDEDYIDLKERAKRGKEKAFSTTEKTMNLSLKRGLTRLREQGQVINFPDKEMRTHYLRKTCATDMADNEAAIHTMTEYLGHTDPKITFDSYYKGQVSSQFSLFSFFNLMYNCYRLWQKQKQLKFIIFSNKVRINYLPISPLSIKTLPLIQK